MALCVCQNHIDALAVQIRWRTVHGWIRVGIGLAGAESEHGWLLVATVVSIS